MKSTEDQGKREQLKQRLLGLRRLRTSLVLVAGVDGLGDVAQVSGDRCFGVHGAIKRFYGVEPDEEIPATLDYMIAAVGAQGRIL